MDHWEKYHQADDDDMATARMQTVVVLGTVVMLIVAAIVTLPRVAFNRVHDAAEQLQSDITQTD